MQGSYIGGDPRKQKCGRGKGSRSRIKAAPSSEASGAPSSKDFRTHLKTVLQRDEEARAFVYRLPRLTCEGHPCGPSVLCPCRRSCRANSGALKKIKSQIKSETGHESELRGRPRGIWDRLSVVSSAPAGKGLSPAAPISTHQLP